MALQLPAEARGTAAAVLTFSFVSDIAGLLLIWLVWTHRERTSCKSTAYIHCYPPSDPRTTRCGRNRVLHLHCYYH